jgi:hypothetical protein
MLFCTPAALLLLLLLAAGVAKEIRSGIKRLDLSLSLSSHHHHPSMTDKKTTAKIQLLNACMRFQNQETAIR